MVCLFGFKDPTLSILCPCHVFFPSRIAYSFREVAGNVILGDSLTGALNVTVEVLTVVSAGRLVTEALKA